jgi:hypothetical protein
VLQGWGGDRLLASYDAERRPIGRRNVRMATAFHALQSGYGEGMDALDEDSKTGATVRRRIGEALVAKLGAEFRTMGLQIGYRYEDSPICVADGTHPIADDPETYRPSARPGMRAPHIWLSERRSILDLFGRGFTLLRLGRTAPDTDAIANAAATRRMPVRIIALDDPQILALYERQLVLVRPDGHVAWRGDASPADAGAILDRARGAS